jgi:hypothetical protein
LRLGESVLLDPQSRKRLSFHVSGIVK